MASVAVYYVSVLFFVVVDVKAETYSGVEELSKPTDLVINAINRYIEDEEKRLDELRRYSSRLRRNSTLVQNAPSDGLAKDALSLFMHIKSLATFPSLMQKKSNAEDYKFVPMDATDAALALFRLQDTYALNTRDMANGNLSSDYSSTDTLRMTASDCFDLGIVAFNSAPPDYYHAVLWFQEACDRLKSGDTRTVDEKELLLRLSISLYHQDNLERATVLVKRLKELDTNFPKVDENLNRYTDELKERNVPLEGLENRLPALRVSRAMDQRFPDWDVYERLCRCELASIESRRSKRLLFCYYKIDNAFLKNAVSRKEADVIKSLAKPELRRSTVSVNEDVTKYRSSKTAWLADEHDPVLAAIGKRVEDMSGLTTSTSENFHVANYDLGGHYVPHFDFAGGDRRHQFANLGAGDRIATVLFYLSDTKAGGATVFPDLRLTVRPRENDALVWYNLFRNGQGDYRTLHAACPVLGGVKWIANKWLHVYGQEFRRPCGLRERD